MIARSQNTACLSVADEADKVPAWKKYARYCCLREKGLRKQAFESLDSFITEATQWDFPSQKTFVLWLCGKMDTVEDADYGPFPATLREKLFLPFFSEYLRRECENDEACALRAQYLGEPQFYQRALEINPQNQRARYALAVACIGNVQYATHHLPHYFIGDEHNVKSIADEARDHISHIEQPDRQKFLRHQLCQEEQLLDDWITFKQESGEDFDAWCRNRGRQHSWGKSHYYEK